MPRRSGACNELRIIDGNFLLAISYNHTMSSNTSDAKKRRKVGGDNECASGGRKVSVHEELKDIKTTMNEMMEHNRVQTENMTNMMRMMQGMQGEITRLTEKCDRMGKSIDTMRRTQKTQYSNMTYDMKSQFDGMGDRFDIVEDKLNYHEDKQAYLEVLIKNQKWKYTLSRPSQEYWINVDHPEDEAAEEFLKDIRQCTEKMRYGTGDDGDDYDGCVEIDAQLSYNEEFLPQWKEFADALKQYQYCLKCLPKDTDDYNYTLFQLCGMELSDTVIDLLSNALESTYFRQFTLQENHFERKGIEFALKYVKSNCILKKFGLYSNPIDDIKDTKQLCKIVKEHPSIEELALHGCRGEGVDGYEMLQMIMNSGKTKLYVINLSGNNISTGGDTFISDFLTNKPMLEALILHGNQLNDNDAIAIASALKYNTNLRVLDVMNNNLTRTGWRVLRKAEFDDTSLNSAADSNHTCSVRYPSGDDEIQGLDTSEMNGRHDSEHDFDERKVREKKVYSVLSSRNRNCTNVGHFDDVPVELLPDMLKCIQQYSNYHIEEDTGEYLTSPCSQDINDVNPLSLVYELCRYWDKSLAVYELLSL